MTARQLFETLPEPMRTRAIKNAEDTRSANVEFQDLKEAIGEAFSWEKTNEGVTYWNNFYNTLKYNE